MANSASSSTFYSCHSTIKSESTDGNDADAYISEGLEFMDEGDVGNTPPAGVVHDVSSEGIFTKQITSWTPLKKLGSGAFGDVYKVRTDDGSLFAVKETCLSGQGQRTKKKLLHLKREIEVYTKYKHKNIVQYIGTDKDKEKLYVFLEFMSKGSLSTLYETCSLGESRVSGYTWQILNGLQYLHKEKVIHRDIKCANILVDASGSVKLADFGLAKATEISAAKTFAGTPSYIAPEVFQSKNTESYGLEADIWSLGCTVLEMLTRKPPYSDVGPFHVMEKIRNGVLPDIPAHLSTDAKDFIHKCL